MSDKIQTIDLREQYFRVSNRIFDLGLSIYEVGVYATICRFVNNDTKMAYPSLNKIASMLNISKRQVIRCMHGLVEKGIIYKKQGKENVCNQYYLLTIHSDRQTLVTHSHLTSDSQSPGVVTDRQPIKTNIKRLIKKTKQGMSVNEYVCTTEFSNELNGLNNDSFLNKYKEWIEFRKKLKKPIKTILAVKKQIKMLQKYSVADAIEIIDTSIRNEWQGLFELKNNNKNVQKTFGQMEDEQVRKFLQGDTGVKGKLIE